MKCDECEREISGKAYQCPECEFTVCYECCWGLFSGVCNDCAPPLEEISLDEV